MNYFFDTSALVKLYHKENGTDQILDIYNSKSVIFISELTKLEFLSSVHRKFRESIINSDILNILIEIFKIDIDNRFKLLNFSSLIIETASDIILKYNKTKFLRTLDIIQISFFEIFCEKDDTFVCSDIRLNEFLIEKSYKSLNPEM